MTWTRPLSVRLAPALVLALGLAVLAVDGFGLPTRLGNLLFDGWQRHLPGQTQTSIRIEPLDLPALDEDTLVAAARALTARGASVIALAAPPEMGASPQSLAAKLPPGSDAARQALALLPEPGHDLAVALQGSRALMPVTLGKPGRTPHVTTRFTYRGAHDPFAAVPRFDTGAAVPAALERQAAGVAATNLPPDADGVIRRLPLAFHLRTLLVPGLAVDAARLAANQPALTVTTDERNSLSFLRGVGIAGLEMGGRVLPTGRDGALRPHFAPPQHPRLDARRLGNASLAGAVIVIGAAGDLLRTPLGLDSRAGVTAQAIGHLLSGRVLARPAWALPAEIAALALLGAGMIGLLRFGLGWSAALTMSGIALLFAASWMLFAAHGILLDAATPSLLLALAFAAGAVAWLQDLRLAHASLRLAFSDSLPRATIEKIARRPALLRMDGETRTVTYLVCGVRGIADIAAAFRDDAPGFTRLMQQALSPLLDQALAHGGTIDRLTADGFTAFWNAPLDDPDHALHACEAANGMAIMSARVTEQLALEMRAHPPAQVEIGVGIATGPVIAGGFGGYGCMGYSVNGPAVTLAQRIQSLSHQYGPALIVAEETRNAAERGFAFLEVDTIAASKSDAPVTLYALTGNPVARASPKFRALEVFHDHIFQAIRRQHWNRARELIAQCRRLSGASQKMYDLHLARIAWYEKHPPGENWDGAFRQPVE